jgi:hypothetical protein
VLVVAGVLDDERQVDREWRLIDPVLRDRYIVVVKSGGPPFGYARRRSPDADAR